jgi:hypothetical protein
LGHQRAENYGTECMFHKRQDGNGSERNGFITRFLEKKQEDTPYSIPHNMSATELLSTLSLIMDRRRRGIADRRRRRRRRRNGSDWSIEWEIVGFVGLWCVDRSDELTPELYSMAEKIVVPHLSRLTRRANASTTIDLSLRVMVVYLQWRKSQEPRAKGDALSEWVHRALDEWWSKTHPYIRPTNHNHALLVCNYLGACRLATEMTNRRNGDRTHPVCIRVATHWRRRYLHASPSEDAAYFATHWIYAVTRWGTTQLSKEDSNTLRPEHRFLFRLVRRSTLVEEIGADATTEVLCCAALLGIRMQSDMFDRLHRICWRVAVAQKDPANDHYIQHFSSQSKRVIYRILDCLSYGSEPTHN